MMKIYDLDDLDYIRDEVEPCAMKIISAIVKSYDIDDILYNEEDQEYLGNLVEIVYAEIKTGMSNAQTCNFSKEECVQSILADLSLNYIFVQMQDRFYIDKSKTIRIN